jgi:hypothetical protein
MRNRHLSRCRHGLVHTLGVSLPVFFFLLVAVMHRVYAYIYSDGSVLCADHASDTSDPGNESGSAYAVYSWEELHSDLMCDVEGCGVILEQNAGDEEEYL